MEIKCDKCGAVAETVTPETAKDGEIEYTFFRCPACGEVYSIPSPRGSIWTPTDRQLVLTDPRPYDDLYEMPPWIIRIGGQEWYSHILGWTSCWDDEDETQDNS